MCSREWPGEPHAARVFHHADPSPRAKPWSDERCGRIARRSSLADSLGFSEAYVGEHATDQAENITSCALFIASLAGRDAPHPARHRYGQPPEPHPVQPLPPRSRCSTTCWKALELRHQPRRDCCRMPRPSATSTRTVPRCSSRGSTWCSDLGGAPPYNLQGQILERSDRAHPDPRRSARASSRARCSDPTPRSS